ncbi:MAG: carboxypeptidase-like regulatory domain-containing protein [Planctomycetota bacterium]
MGKKALAVGAALAALVGAGVWLRPWDEKEVDPALAVDVGSLERVDVRGPALVGHGDSAAPHPGADEEPVATGFAHIDVEVTDDAGQPLPDVPVRLQTWDRATTYSHEAGALAEMVDAPHQPARARHRAADHGRRRAHALRTSRSHGGVPRGGRARSPVCHGGRPWHRGARWTGRSAHQAGCGRAAAPARGGSRRSARSVRHRLGACSERPGSSVRWSSGPQWTDAEGRLRLSGVPTGTLRADVLLPGFARRTAVRVHTPAADEVLIHLRTEPGATLKGYVRDVAGHPVAGARIVAWSGSQNTFEPMTVRSVASDGSGAYRIDGLPAGTLLGLDCTAQGLVGPAPQLLRRELRSGELVDQDFVLAIGCTIRGHVRTSAGEAIAEAHVSAIVNARGASMGWQAKATCGADGSYELGPLPAGTASLTPRAAGFLSDAEATTVVLSGPGASEVVDFELEAGAPLEGVVVDAEERGIEGATLTLYGPSSLWKRYPAFEVVATGADGRFRFPGLPAAEQYVVRLRAGDAYLVQLLQPGAFNKLRVPRMGEIHGRVVWAGSGPPGPREVIVRPAASGAQRGRDHVGGLVALAADDTFVVRGLEAGAIELLVHDCFYDPAGQVLEWDVAEGQVIRDVELRVGPFLEVGGHVVDARGSTRAGTTVTLSELGGQHRAATRRTDGDGAFRFVRVPVGAYRVSAEGTDGGLEVHADAPALRLVARDSQRITRGSITFADGRPVPGGSVVHQTVSAGNRRSWQMHPIYAGSFEIATDAEVEALVLRVERVYELDGTQASVRPWGGTHTPGEPLRIVLERIPLVRGVVVDDSGAPVPGIRLAAQVDDATGVSGMTLVTSDAAGRFALPGFEAGQRVRITLPGVPAGFAMPRFDPVHVGVDEIRLVLPRGGAEVRGRVVDDAGEPVAGVRCSGASPARTPP